MTSSVEIINWETVFASSTSFKKQKPTRFAFIENIFFNDFYKELYDTYPNLDLFIDGSDYSKSQLVKEWKNVPGKYVAKGDDSELSQAWNVFKKYLEKIGRAHV